MAGDVAVERRVVAAGASPADPGSQEVRTPATTLIVDPPATGLSAEMRRAILDSPPRTMIYVSCNPPTLARDLAQFQSHFSVVSFTPFDMFPQTAEIEVVAHLTCGRKAPNSKLQAP